MREEGRDTTHTHTLKRRRRRRLQTSVSVTIDLPGTIDPSTCPARALHSPRTVLLLPLRSILEKKRKQTVRTGYRRKRKGRKGPTGGARAVREYVIHTHSYKHDVELLHVVRRREGREKRWREECIASHRIALHRIAMAVECVVMNSKRIWKRIRKRMRKKKKKKKLHTQMYG